MSPWALWEARERGSEALSRKTSGFAHTNSGAEHQSNITGE